MKYLLKVYSFIVQGPLDCSGWRTGTDSSRSADNADGGTSAGTHTPRCPCRNQSGQGHRSYSGDAGVIKLGPHLERVLAPASTMKNVGSSPLRIMGVDMRGRHCSGGSMHVEWGRSVLSQQI